MWNFCDDRGVHKASAKRLKMEVFPGDEITINEVESLVQELLNNNLIKKFTHQDVDYWYVIGWKEHQRIDRPTKSSNPEPPIDSYDDTPESKSTQRALDEDSTSARKGKEGKGKERKGKDNNKYIVEACAKPETKTEKIDPVVQDIFFYWQEIMGKGQSKLLPARERIITRALKVYPPEVLKAAISGCAKTKWNMGDNPENKLYNDIEYILRVSQKHNNIERFSEHDKQPSKQSLDDKINELF